MVIVIRVYICLYEHICSEVQAIIKRFYLISALLVVSQSYGKVLFNGRQASPGRRRSGVGVQLSRGLLIWRCAQLASQLPQSLLFLQPFSLQKFRCKRYIQQFTYPQISLAFCILYLQQLLIVFAVVVAAYSSRFIVCC